MRLAFSAIVVLSALIQGDFAVAQTEPKDPNNLSVMTISSGMTWGHSVIILENNTPVVIVGSVTITVGSQSMTANKFSGSLRDTHAKDIADKLNATLEYAKSHGDQVSINENGASTAAEIIQNNR